MKLKRKRVSAFPITMCIVEHATARRYKIDENSTTTCVFCKSMFLINEDTAYIIVGSVDKEPLIRCPVCNHRATAFYYAKPERLFDND